MQFIFNEPTVVATICTLHSRIDLCELLNRLIAHSTYAAFPEIQLLCETLQAELLPPRFALSTLLNIFSKV
jgi:hypothetical protein